MKKALITLIIISAYLSACKKTDKPAFDKSPDERLNEILAAYQTQLSGATSGWKAILKVDSGKGAAFSFYFKFNDANRVVMRSDFDSLSAVTPKESSYRLKALQQPSLLFDTYSYLHVLSDPDETVNGGIRGAGLLSDFEFYFDSVTTDTIKLTGRQNGSRLVLIRATTEEAASYDNNGLARGFLFQNIGKYLNYFKRVTIGGVTYEISVNQLNRTVTFSWLDANGVFQTFTTYYYYTVTGIQFYTALINGGQPVTGFTNLSWDAASTTLSFSVNGSATTVIGSGQPLKVDLQAPARWWNAAVNNGNTYWFSPLGFHVNGIDDAFGVQSLTSGTSTYYYWIYYPKFGTNNDFFGPVFLNATHDTISIDYGSAPRIPTFTSDGRAIFNELGTYGTYPSTGPAALSKDLLYNPSGYYFVQTSSTSYDMISAVDGKAWISWQF